MARKCFLRCLENSHPPIELVNKVATLVGRSRITKIKDQSCSRGQLSLTANFEDYTVELKQIGINPSGFDGFATSKGISYKLSHGSRVEILLNNYIHTIEFDPPPDEIKTNGKRKLDEEQTIPKKMKRSYVPTAENSWENVDNGELYVFTSKGVLPSSKIASFDMDGTLIKTKSGKVHPVDINDWQLAFPQVSSNLKEKVSDGFKIVIMSNQAPIGNGRVKIEDFKKKVQGVVEKIGTPAQVYIATGKGIYRKPATGMWKCLVEKHNEGLAPDMSRSFYCGDAAGRPANWAPGRKKDHSMADRLMAENLALTFFTPEQYFLGHSVANVPMTKPEFDPKSVKTEPFNERLICDQQEILVLVGYPGSGKSTLAAAAARRSAHRYAAVCRDALGSWQKCVAEATKLIKENKSVIVDSTNPDAESRARWTRLAAALGVRARCARLAVPLAHARHNNKYRELMKANHMSVNDVVYHCYTNKYVEPSTKEGFDEVLTVKFGGAFDRPEEEALYRLHLLEK